MKKGSKCTIEHREKVSKALTGRVRIFSEQHKKRLSEVRIGKKYPKLSEALKNTFKNGRKHPFEGKKRPDLAGANCHLWKGGITKKHLAIRTSLEYKLWRKSVFERDNYTCVFCGIRGGNLEADHIKPFCDYPELRFAIDNGRTLCVNCHRKTDTYKRPKR